MAGETRAAGAGANANTAGGKPVAAWRRSSWLALAILGVYWGVCGLVMLPELPYFYRFLFSMAAPLLLLIAFSIWWWTRANLKRTERIVGYLLVVIGTVACAPLTHASLGVSQMLMIGLPLSMTTWMLWTLLAQRQSVDWPWRRIGALAVLAITCGSMMVIRMEGLNGDLRASLHSRWTPTAEELFLAAQPKSVNTGAIADASVAAKNSPADANQNAVDAAAVDAAAVDAAAVDAAAVVVTAEQGDWPRFRGAKLDGVVPGVVLSAAEWAKSPPRLIWKQRIGPAWSSVSIVGDRLFTQEQRGEQEAVVCYEAGTGKQLWIHQDPARFYEAVSGPGPRATPTFADSRIFTLGATGILNCLDAGSGRRLWTHDLQKEVGAVIPMWGISSSPLVVENLVYVYGGGESQTDLLAYDVESGALAWSASAGGASYASPQLATVDGQQQVLILCDEGLFAFEPKTGKLLWQGGEAMPGAPRNLQAHIIAGAQVLAGTLSGIGVGLADLAKTQDQWTATNRWTSTDMKPEFSEMVVHDGYAYGFDGAVFCCLDLASGKRTWKKGRYGRGQVVLLPEQSQLLVLSESGELVLVAAEPAAHRELGRFQALTGKTWNHPVIAHGRLWVRNAEEIACYELGEGK